MKVIRCRVMGLYVNAESYGNQTHQYAHLLWCETLEDGTQRMVNGRPFFAHDWHPVLTALFPALAAIWRTALPLLKEWDDTKEEP